MKTTYTRDGKGVQAEPNRVNASFDAEPAQNFGRIDLGVIASLLLLALLCNLPVLLFPHWCQFGDSAEIIDNCRKFFGSHHYDWKVLEGYHRPGTHMIQALIWFFSPEKPDGFYWTRFFFYAVTVACTYINCFLMSRSRLIGFVCACFLFCASPIFEVLFTLDKAEVNIGFANSLIVTIFLAMQSRLQNRPSASRLPRHVPTQKGFIVGNQSQAGWTQILLASAAIFFLAIFGMFTKETGRLPLIFLGALTVLTLGAQRIKAFNNAESKPIQSQTIWTVAALISCAIPFVLFRLYVALSSAEGYGQLNFASKFLWRQFKNYAILTPDIVGLNLFCLVGLVAIWLFAGKVVSRNPSMFLSATAFGATGILASAALMAWQGQLVYFWYPIILFLLPATAYVLSTIAGGAANRVRAISGIVMLMLLTLVPSRFVEAQVEFNMDSVVNDVAKEVANRRERYGQMGVPFSGPEFFEIPEMIQGLALCRLNNTPNEYVNEKNVPIKFFNCMITGSKDDEKTKNKYSKFEHLIRARSFKSGLGPSTFSLWRNDGDVGWVENNLQPGDLLLVPNGNLPIGKVAFRGACLFSQDLETQLSQFPQLQLQPEFNVTRDVATLDGRHYSMGWSALRVQSITPVTWNLTSDGWLLDKDYIEVPNSMSGKVLNLTTYQVFPRQLRVRVAGGPWKVVNALGDKSRGTFEIPLKLNSDAGTSRVEFQSDSLLIPAHDPRALMLRVDKVELK